MTYIFNETFNVTSRDIRYVHYIVEAPWFDDYGVARIPSFSTVSINDTWILIRTPIPWYRFYRPGSEFISSGRFIARFMRQGRYVNIVSSYRWSGEEVVCSYITSKR